MDFIRENVDMFKMCVSMFLPKIPYIFWGTCLSFPWLAPLGCWWFGLQLHRPGHIIVNETGSGCGSGNGVLFPIANSSKLSSSKHQPCHIPASFLQKKRQHCSRKQKLRDRGNCELGGGFNCVLISPLVGEMVQSDRYVSDGLKPPTRLRIADAGSINTQLTLDRSLEGHSAAFLCRCSTVSL